ncbi:Uma2 family endonuclease [Methylorubrum sp. Q1]|uniref:Uma2 family endonuclease n=1 Tax=Methylorubrum sp. Q1 TaxID=2562453 RepID=UPI00107644E4|nr:Uma2 family endonuclease [Methylorubrum sp. Q1]TFZ58424.1 Uma2 family endonuclease [Methylorubrum sp. Q1]
MSVQPKTGPTARMNVDEFLAWAEGQPGRYELVVGEVFAMSPQRAVHARVKYRVHRALDRAIETAGLPCEMFPDGMTVRVDADTSFEPDALVHCGDRLADNAVETSDPLIIVEVLSPSTRHVDTGTKLMGYFRLPSLCHYLILDTERRTVIHHRRSTGDLIETRIAASGDLVLDPPGLRLAVASLFAEP